jgi:hypothetical protein
MEDVVLTVVRDIAIGTPVDASVATFLAADLEHLTRLPPAETADQSIFVRKLLQLVNAPASHSSRG